jgi:hypothetical protein
MFVESEEAIGAGNFVNYVTKFYFKWFFSFESKFEKIT